MNIKPLGDRVVIKPDIENLTTESGLHLPEGAADKPQSGVVVALGSDVTEPISVGDSVLYAKYGGTEIASNGDSYLIIKEQDLLAVVL